MLLSYNETKEFGAVKTVTKDQKQGGDPCCLKEGYLFESMYWP
jgi:hypothetical protein